jgi:hypothetical protein
MTCEKVIMHRYAGQIMRYLSHNGSNVKVLAIRPLGTSEDLLVYHGDKNRDCPVHYYLRASVTDVRGIRGVTVVPLEEKIVHAEMAGSTILLE